jgi:hydroxymethylbilane synthase
MLVIGSRGSQLALWQANYIQQCLADRGIEARIEIIQTTGDRVTNVPLSQLGAMTSTKGLFTKELEEALLDGRIHLAVHSLKDMPTELPEGLRLAAIPAREDVRDALIGKTLDELPFGARVGTSALRRQAQLRALRPDLEIDSVRGNVDTRLRKLDEGQFDAIMLAAAGLRRLGWGNRITQYMSIDEMCPAVGQGALAIETTNDFHEVDLLEDPTARAAITAERSLLQALGGGCQVPIGAHANITGRSLHLRAVVASADGALIIRQETEGPVAEAAELGARLADELIENGAREILDDGGA